MKIGYGTYGMQTENIFHILPRLRDIGYEAVEINAGDDWPTAPHKLDAGSREALAKTTRTWALNRPLRWPCCRYARRAMNAPPFSKNLTRRVSSPATSRTAMPPASSSAHWAG